VKSPALLLLALLLPPSALAQTGTVTGRVFQKGSKNAVPTAEVMLLRTKFHTWSALDGRFTLKDVPPGDYELTAVGGGFLPSSTQAVHVDAGLTTDVEVLLDTPFFQGDEILVKGQRAKSVGQQGLTREELKKIPGSFDDPLRGLQVLPGVASPNDFATTFLLDGSDQYDNAVLVDGVPVDLPFHLGGFVSTIHPDAIKSADVYSAGFGPRYGDAIGGALEVTTREPRRDRFAADLNFNPILPDAMLEAPLPGNGGIMVAARRSYFDILLHHIKDLTVVPVFEDGIVKVSYDLDNRGILAVTALGATDGFAVDNGANTNGGQSTNFFKHLTREFTDWKWYWTDDVKTDFTLYHGADGLSSVDEEFSQPNPPQINDVGLTKQLWGARGQADVEWLPWLKTTLGGNYEDNKFSGSALYQNYIDQENESAGQIVNRESLTGTFQTVSGYVDQKIRVFEPLWISLGGRVDERIVAENFFDVGVSTFIGAARTRETHVSPRASFELALGAKTKLRGSWGQYYQWPSLDTPPFDVLVNPGLRAESAHHYVVGLERDLPGDVFARVEGFYKTMNNLIVDPTPDVNNENQHLLVVGPSQLQNTGRGWAKGGEFFVRKKVGSRFVGWASYTYERSWRTLAPGQPQIPAAYDQNNIMTILGSYQFSRRWEFSAKWNSHSGNPYTPLEEVINVGGGNHGVYGPVYSARLPSYQRLDLRLTKTVVKKSWTISYYFDIINATNHANVLNIRYFSSSNNGHATVTPQVDKELPLIPFFGIRCQY